MLQGLLSKLTNQEGKTSKGKQNSQHFEMGVLKKSHNQNCKFLQPYVKLTRTHIPKIVFTYATKQFSFNYETYINTVMLCKVIHRLFLQLLLSLLL